MIQKTVILTGGSDGVGAEIARKLSELDHQIIIPCRNIEKGNALVNKLGPNVSTE